MPRLALKIDVDTYRGTLVGVPHLVEILRRHQAGATFLFSLGPDHTGRAIKRVFRPGFFGKVSRTSVVGHYGFKTLMYGTLLPGPDIGRRCKDILLGTPRRRLRGRHPLLGSHPLAGRCRNGQCRLDGAGNDPRRPSALLKSSASLRMPTAPPAGR